MTRNELSAKCAHQSLLLLQQQKKRLAPSAENNKMYDKQHD